jgi:hypothetical protein
MIGIVYSMSRSYVRMYTNPIRRHRNTTVPVVSTRRVPDPEPTPIRPAIPPNPERERAEREARALMSEKMELRDTMAKRYPDDPERQARAVAYVEAQKGL